MSRLCLGTFFKAITLCVTDNSFKQGEDFRNIFGLMDHTYDPSPDLISKFARGVRNPSKAFIDIINRYDPDQYGELCFCMDDIAKKINNKSEIVLVKTIKKIANEDETIPDYEIVDLVNGTRKKDLPGDYKDLSAFLTGIFLYVIKHVKNDGMNEYVKQINQLYIAEFMNEDEQQSQVNNSGYSISESEELSVRRFMLTHENELSLIPLCQIVYAYNPSHNYERAMFTEYNLLSKVIRKQILDQCNASNMIECDNLRWEEGLSLLCSDLRLFNLSSGRYDYMFMQYFSYGLRFAPYSISQFEDYSFNRLLIPERPSDIASVKRCDLDSYIDDFLYAVDNHLDIVAIMPFDMLCKNKKLDSCQGEELMYWLCRFIIYACNNLSFRITGKPMSVNCYDGDAETIEDLFFSAIYALHKHYYFHNDDCMGFDIDLRN